MSRRTHLLDAHERMFPVHPEKRVRAAAHYDWGMADQRLAARNAQVQRIAVRVQLVIMAVTAAALAIAAPGFFYDIALGLTASSSAAIGQQGTPQ